MTKPDFMVMVPDLYHRRRRHQGRRRLSCHPPEPQEYSFKHKGLSRDDITLFLGGEGESKDSAQMFGSI